MSDDWSASLDAHRGHLFGLCYRMTGSAADAEDLVQATFLRVLERPPEDLDRPLRPWLTKVALNLARDALRRRRARTYLGPWLPAPIDTDRSAAWLDATPTAARYEQLESVSYAFLVALEILSPRQRAVLLLRDVFDHGTRETAEALGTSEANVKVILHRARGKMASYDAERRPPSPALAEATQAALLRLLRALARRDHDDLLDLLAEEVRGLSDGGGELLAALRPLEGRDRVLRFATALAERRGPPDTLEIRTLNGLPAALLSFARGGPREARRAVIRIDLDRSARVRTVQTILASEKIAHLGP